MLLQLLSKQMSPESAIRQWVSVSDESRTDAGRLFHTWSVDGKRSVAKRRSGQWDLRFGCWQWRSKTGPTSAAVISQVGRCRGR